MQVVVDEARCAATGACVQVCPEVFVLDGRTVRVVDPEPADALLPKLHLAAELCPTGAIRLEAQSPRMA